MSEISLSRPTIIAPSRTAIECGVIAASVSGVLLAMGINGFLAFITGIVATLVPLARDWYANRTRAKIRSMEHRLFTIEEENVSLSVSLTAARDAGADKQVMIEALNRTVDRQSVTIADQGNKIATLERRVADLTNLVKSGDSLPTVQLSPPGR